MDLQAPPHEPSLAAHAPPVVVVMVTCDAGPWLEEVLRALAAQDYPDLSVLVIDAASQVDPTARVAAVLPRAFVRRLPANEGYAAAANEALTIVQGASHLLFLHDDAAPEADAVRVMVEEAFRSNAGVVAPKLVQWDDPNRLLAVGMSADKSGVVVPYGRGELDQEQHDSVRDVFVAPGACTLVRADLFATLGGFDPAMPMFGEDVDLCWRAQVLGARVVVAPGARVRHLEATAAGRRPLRFGWEGETLADRARPLQLRHRLRTVLKSYGIFHLARVVPLILALAVAETAYGLATGRLQAARAVVSSWRWNLRRLGAIRAGRRALQRQRVVPDRDVRRLQTRGSARILAFARGQLRAQPRGRGLAAAGRDIASSLGTDRLRLALLVWTTLVAVLVVGSRGLLGGRIAAVGQLAAFPDGPTALLRPFVSGWRTSGLGSAGPAPTAFGLLGVAGALLGGAMSVLRKLLVLGALPAGIVGAFRLAAPIGSLQARLVAVTLYAANPLPYAALARGRWHGLLAYAAAPWVLARLARVTGLEPFGAAAGFRRQALGLAVLLALLAALAPPAAFVTVLVALGLLVGSVLGGGAGRATRAVGLALAGLAGAAVLLFPWTVELGLAAAAGDGALGLGRAPAQAPGLGALIRFHVGPARAEVLGWALLVAATLPLVLGRGWRLAWAIRLWSVAALCWGVAWAGGRGWLLVAPPSPDVLLAPAAVAMALSAALGLLAFETDLRGYRFGWRQVASVAAGVAAALAAVPLLDAAVGGRWGMPDRDFSELLSWMPEQAAAGTFRVLWVGDPEALPLEGWHLDDGLAYGVSRDGPTDATALWPGSDRGATSLLADRLAVARRGETTHLGQMLAPMAVRYVVVPTRAAPAREGTPDLPPPADVLDALLAQVDLRRVHTDDAVVVYENAAWGPGRTLLGPEAAEASRLTGEAAERGARLAGAPAVLTEGGGPTGFRGDLPAGAEVHLSEAASSGWRLDVAGREAERRRSFGWANGFTVAGAGAARLSYRTPPALYGALAAHLGLWLLALRSLARGRQRARGEVA